MTDHITIGKMDTNQLLANCQQQNTIQEIAVQLNVSAGTVRRWIELDNVPQQYTFDLHKLLGMEIDYSKYSSSSKDQFFTPKHIAEHCWTLFQNELQLDADKYTFIEPSAGDGSFLKVLPSGTIGMDIEPRSAGIQLQDYLSWNPTDTTKPYIVFGNPPFGLRGHLALNFLNHSLTFADYVCFILPQLFESDGKGSPRKRVKGGNLIFSQQLTAVFYSPENQDIKVNGVVQIWSKYTSNAKYTLQTTTQSNIRIYSLSDGGTVASTRNKDMIGHCDVYLPSTCFGKDNMRPYTSFDELPNKKGYGIVFQEDKEQLLRRVQDTDWTTVSFLSTNSAYNLRTSLILEQLGKVGV